MNSPKTAGNAVSRRQFLQSSALATAALGLGSTARGDTMAQGNQRQSHAPGSLHLWYDQPAMECMTAWVSRTEMFMGATYHFMTLGALM